MEFAQLSTDGLPVIVAVSGAVGSLLTLVLTKGVDALLKIKADGRIDKHRASDEIENGYKFIIAKQDQRITQLEAEVKDLRGKYQDEVKAIEAEHADCEKKYAVLNSKVEGLQKELDAHRRQ